MTTRPGSTDLAEETSRRPGHAVKRAEQAVTAAKAAVLRGFGLTLPQYTCLFTLSHRPGASGAQLARLCAVTPQTTATVLANLEAKGLVRRTPSSVHQKVFATRLTRSGTALLRRADVGVRAVERDLADAFTDEERARFAEYLDRAVRALEGR